MSAGRGRGGGLPAVVAGTHTEFSKETDDVAGVFQSSQPEGDMIAGLAGRRAALQARKTRAETGGGGLLASLSRLFGSGPASSGTVDGKPGIREAFFDFLAGELKAASDDRATGQWYRDNAAISMCERDTLIAATVAAALTGGPVVEFGPYIGGTTIAFGRGLKVSGGRLISFEKGGAYLEHPRLPTSDILADLKANLERAGILDRTTIIERNYDEPDAFDELERALEGEKIRLVLIDADGYFDRLFVRLRPLLADDAIILVDDYVVWDSPPKEGLTRSEMDGAIARGEIATWGLLSGVTWIGSLPGGIENPSSAHAPGSLSGFAALSHLFAWRITERDGHATVVSLPKSWLRHADTLESKSSPLLIFEDGKLIGPGHSNIQDVIDKGNGRYIHWRGRVYFSSSDNSDPFSNGRRYTLRLGDQAKTLELA